MRKETQWKISLLLFGVVTAAILRASILPAQQGRYLEELDEDVPEGDATESVIVLVIVLSLIAMTIVFEVAKEHVEEHADQNMQRIVEKLFGEMTVLGFLSICTFCITKSGFFEILSERLYDGDRHELLELFEQIHFAIFAIMVFFVLQVLVLVREAMETEARWIEMDHKARALSSGYIGWDGQRRRRSIWRLLPGCRQLQQQQDDDFMMFYAMRKEFLLDRNVEPPFAPADEQLPDDFAFGRYLSVCLGSMLAHVVEVSTATWMLFAALSCVYAALHWYLSVDGLVVVWISTGWFVFMIDVVFESHLLMVRELLACPDHPIKDPSENTPLGSGLLPGWTKIDLDAYQRRRSWIIKRWVGGKPNRQQALYWADRKGPKVYLLALQVKLIFVGLYISVHLLEFWTPMNEKYPFPIIAGYVVLSLLPILATIFQAQHLVATLSQVCCLGSYRRPNVIAAVLREIKTRAAIRSFFCIYKMRRFATLAAHAENDIEHEYVGTSVELSKVERDEVYKTFDSFDLDGNGTITMDEIQQLMSSLGAPMPTDTLEMVMQHLDDDGDMKVTRPEFLQWYSQTMAQDDGLTESEQAELLFALFDRDRSGEITIGEFQAKVGFVAIQNLLLCVTMYSVCPTYWLFLVEAKRYECWILSRRDRSNCERARRRQQRHRECTRVRAFASQVSSQRVGWGRVRTIRA